MGGHAWDRGTPAKRQADPGIPLAIGREIDGLLQTEIVATPEELAAIRQEVASQPAFRAWLRRLRASTDDATDREVA